MKISSKLPLIFTVFSVMTLGLVVGVSWKGNEILKDRTLDSVEQQATLLIRLIERNLFERYHDADSFPLSLGKLEGDSLAYLKDRPGIEKNLNSLVENYKVYRRIAIFDVDGNLLVSSTRNNRGASISDLTLSKEEVSQSSWFQNVISGSTLDPGKPDGTYVLGPERHIFDATESSYDMLFASNIYSESGKLLGVWANLVDFSAVESIVANSHEIIANRGIPSAQLTILDRHGRVIVDFDPVGKVEAVYSRDFSILDNLNLVSEGVIAARLVSSGLTGANITINGRNHAPQVTGYAHSKGAYDYPGLGWSAIVRIDSDKAFEESNSLRNTTLILGILLLLAILAITFFMSLRISKPLTELTKVVNRLTRGDLKFEMPKISRGNEIGEISAALKTLRRKLEEREQLITKSEEQQELLDLQRRAINSTATGIVISDARKKNNPLIYVNRAFELLTGYNSEDVLGQNSRYLQGDEVDQPELKTLRMAIKTGKSCNVVLRNYKKDGTLFFNNLRIDPVYSEESELKNFIGVLTDITELKRKESESKRLLEQEVDDRTQEFRDSESRLRVLFDTAIDGTVVLSDAGMIIDVNRSAERICGWARDELLGQPFAILFPQDQHSHFDAFSNSQQFKDPSREVKAFSALHKSGHNIPIEMSIGATLLGEVHAYVAVLRDITEQEKRKESERVLKAALKERELIYRTAFSQAAVGIARVSLDGDFIEVNDKLCEYLGYEEVELLKRNFSDITGKTEMAEELPQWSALIGGDRRSFSTDRHCVRQDGSSLWANLSVSLVKEQDGRPRYFIAIVEDISSRKSIESELREAKEMHDELLRGQNLASDAAGICNWSLDLQSYELTWDESMLSLYGLPNTHDVEYGSWRNAVHPEDIDEAENAVTYAIETKGSFNHEFRIIQANSGETRWIKAAAHVLADDAGTALKLYGINLDVTEERLTQQALEKEKETAQQASEAKSRFLATMSHEIRTPMNGVVGMIDLLRETQLSPDQMRMVGTVRDSSFSLLEIINDILDFSKIEAGKMEIDPTESHILTLVEKTVEALWVNAESKGVELIIEYDFDTPDSVFIDAVRVRQILLNLVGNAIKFSHRAEARGLVIVKVSYETSTNWLCIEVKDNGVGMSLEQVNRLFMPFSQADTSTTRKYGGTGLGLSITKSFVDLMGGAISVESELNKGSTFRVYIPSSIEEIEQDPETLRYDFSALSACVSVGSPDLRAICVNILRQFGCTSLTCEGEDDIWTEVSTDGNRRLSVTDTIKAKHPDADCQIVLDANPVEPKGLRDNNKFIVGQHPLKPSEFAHGIAVLLGVASPLVEWSDESLSGCAHIEPPSIEEAEKEGTLCLVAEDQPTNQIVLEQQLTRLGYAFEMASNGAEALAKWQPGRFSVLLTDCHMPIMDGFELTSEIRLQEKSEGRKRTKIIAITANALVGEAEHCLEAGMDDYVSKPVELRLLRKTLAVHVNKKKASSNNSEPKLYTDQKPQEETESKEQPISLSYVSDLLGTEDPDLLRRVVKMFWKGITKDIDALRMAFARKDTDQIEKISHGMKGVAMSGGALPLGDLLRELERNSNDVEIAAASMEGVERQLQLIEEFLRSNSYIDQKTESELGV